MLKHSNGWKTKENAFGRIWSLEARTRAEKNEQRIEEVIEEDKRYKKKKMSNQS